MQRWENYLAEIGQVETIDYPYMREGRKRPNRLPQLIASHREALAKAWTKSGPDLPTFLVGKSMGGRIGCHVALEEKVSGVICLGYPLCAMGDHAKMRDEVLLALRTPVLFVQGTRDTLCPLDLLASVREKMSTPNELHVVEGGDHSLAVGKRQLKADRETQEEIDRKILVRIQTFVASLGDARGVGTAA
ncbi:MAG: alpha/beta family hydrolase [Chthoniobacterales bacterium]